MKSKIRVLFESFISCGKPSKGNDIDQEPVPIDEPRRNAQGQGHEDEPKHYEQVKDESTNVELEEMVIKSEKETARVGGVFVMESRIQIRAVTKLGRTSRPNRRNRGVPPPDFKTGSWDI